MEAPRKEVMNLELAGVGLVYITGDAKNWLLADPSSQAVISYSHMIYTAYDSRVV